MRGLKFAAGLVAASLFHFWGASMWGGFFLVLDLFLVLALFNALDGDLTAGMLGGLAAGLVSDVLTGGLFGLHGFADTIVGYGAAFASQRIAIQRATGVLLFFLLAATLQQAITMSLNLLLTPAPSLPGFPSVLVKVLLTGLAGPVGFAARRRAVKLGEAWRRTRRARLR